MDAEWWYNDAAYHYAKGESVALACLIVRPDHTARVVTDVEILDFDSPVAARSWLLDEEYRRLQDLADEHPDPRIRPPAADREADLPGHMVLDLRGGPPPVASPGGPDTSPAHH